MSDKVMGFTANPGRMLRSTAISSTAGAPIKPKPTAQAQPMSNQEVYVCDWWNECCNDFSGYEAFEYGQNSVAYASLSSAKAACVGDCLFIVLEDLNEPLSRSLNADVTNKQLVDHILEWVDVSEHDDDLRKQMIKYKMFALDIENQWTTGADGATEYHSLKFPNDNYSDVWTVRAIKVFP